MENTRYHIGIDPDVEKSGVACWDKEDKEFIYIMTLSFFDLIFELSHRDNITVHIEASWLHGTVTYGAHDGAQRFAAVKVAAAVGANRQIGKLLEEYCIKFSIPHQLHKPTKAKLDAAAFKNLTHWENATNSEKRDAAMLVFGI